MMFLVNGVNHSPQVASVKPKELATNMYVLSLGRIWQIRAVIAVKIRLIQLATNKMMCPPVVQPKFPRIMVETNTIGRLANIAKIDKNIAPIRIIALSTENFMI